MILITGVIIMDNKDKLKRNILGGKVYIPKTEAQRKAEIAEMEAKSKAAVTKLRKKKENNA